MSVEIRAKERSQCPAVGRASPTAVRGDRKMGDPTRGDMHVRWRAQRRRCVGNGRWETRPVGVCKSGGVSYSS